MWAEQHTFCVGHFTKHLSTFSHFISQDPGGRHHLHCCALDDLPKNLSKGDQTSQQWGLFTAEGPQSHMGSVSYTMLLHVVIAKKSVGKKSSISYSLTSVRLTTLKGKGFRTLRINKWGEIIEQKEKNGERPLTFQWGFPSLLQGTCTLAQ